MIPACHTQRRPRVGMGGGTPRPPAGPSRSRIKDRCRSRELAVPAGSSEPEGYVTCSSESGVGNWTRSRTMKCLGLARGPGEAAAGPTPPEPSDEGGAVERGEGEGSLPPGAPLAHPSVCLCAEPARDVRPSSCRAVTVTPIRTRARMFRTVPDCQSCSGAGTELTDRSPRVGNNARTRSQH